MANPKWADQRTLEEFFPVESGRVCASGGETGIERQEGDQRAMRAGTAVEGGRTERKESIEVRLGFLRSPLGGVVDKTGCRVEQVDGTATICDQETLQAQSL